VRNITVQNASTSESFWDNESYKEYASPDCHTRNYTDEDLDKQSPRQKSFIIDPDNECDRKLIGSDIQYSNRQDAVEYESEEEKSDNEDATTNNDDFSKVDEKLRQLLVPGDYIIDIFNCIQLDGIETCPGVLLIGKTYLYIIDNYRGVSSPSNHSSGEKLIKVEVYSKDSNDIQFPNETIHGSWQVNEVKSNAPVQSAWPSKDAQPPVVAHDCRFWPYEDIIELHKRRYQLRHVALEMFSRDGRNYLVRTFNFSMIYACT